MKTIYLYRKEFFTTCTRGLLIDPETNKLWYTLERPWLDNESNISCIPKGTYTCKWHYSPSFGWVYLVTEVTDRSYILFHSGNVVRHTKGCILIGSRFGYLGSAPAVLSSKPAVRDFFSHLNQQDFKLEVF